MKNRTDNCGTEPNGGIRKNRAGVSIIEVMIALAIFAVFTSGTCKLLVSHRRVLDLARDNYTAINLAKERMELARTFEFDQIPELAETKVLLNESGIPAQHGHFRRTTTISMLSSNLYQLAISVDIQNRKTLQFAPAQQSINTYISKHL